LQPISDETGRGVVLDPLPAVVRLKAPTTTLAATILVLAASSTLAAEWVVVGSVVGVSDGDTLTLLDDAKTQHKGRVAGIDAPEKGQAFGGRSRQNLAQMAHGRGARGECHKMDRFGREVCKVWVQPLDGVAPFPWTVEGLGHGGYPQAGADGASFARGRDCLWVTGRGTAFVSR
jgi:endonuclease YncB( thermonuclease family)